MSTVLFLLCISLLMVFWASFGFYLTIKWNKKNISFYIFSLKLDEHLMSVKINF